MIVHLTAQQFDINGAVILDCLPDVNSGEVRRRTNRVATLDGSAAFNNFGFSEADRTISLKWQPTSEADEAAVSALVRNNAFVYVSMPDGLWLAAPEAYTPGAKESRLTLLVSEKISQE